MLHLPIIGILGYFGDAHIHLGPILTCGDKIIDTVDFVGGTFEKEIKILGQNCKPGFPLMKVYVYWIFIIPRWDCEYLFLAESVTLHQVSGAKSSASISLFDRPTQLCHILIFICCANLQILETQQGNLPASPLMNIQIFVCCANKQI